MCVGCAWCAGGVLGACGGVRDVLSACVGCALCAGCGV